MQYFLYRQDYNNYYMILGFSTAKLIFVHFCSESNVMTLLVFDGFMEGKKEHSTWISSLRWTRRGNGEK